MSQCRARGPAGIAPELGAVVAETIDDRGVVPEPRCTVDVADGSKPLRDSVEVPEFAASRGGTQTPELSAGVLRPGSHARPVRRSPTLRLSRAPPSYSLTHDYLGIVRTAGGEGGREEEVESFLRAALDTVDTEDGTPLWFVLCFGPSSFAIFDASPDDAARQAHLSGEVPGSLMDKAPQLLASGPTIERADVLAGKVDIAALEPQSQ